MPISAQAQTAEGGGSGSHSLPNHVIGKQMVNTTLPKGPHAQTWRTARNFLIFFYTIAVRPFITLYYFLTGEDDYSQDQFPAIH